MGEWLVCRNPPVKRGLLPPNNAASTSHEITRPDSTTVDSPDDVVAVVHSHFDRKLTRATLSELAYPPWENPDNPDPFTIEPRGDPSLICDEYSPATEHCMTLYMYALINSIRAFPSDGRTPWVRRYCNIHKGLVHTVRPIPHGTYMCAQLIQLAR
jgi:hypothetical protein